MKNATDMCPNGCLSEREAPLRPGNSSIWKGLWGLVCRHNSSSETCALNKLLDSVEDAVSIHHLITSKSTTGLIFKVMLVFNPGFSKAGVDISRFQLPLGSVPPVCRRMLCATHPAKIYLTLNRFPKEHPTLSNRATLDAGSLFCSISSINAKKRGGISLAISQLRAKLLLLVARGFERPVILMSLQDTLRTARCRAIVSKDNYVQPICFLLRTKNYSIHLFCSPFCSQNYLFNF